MRFFIVPVERPKVSSDITMRQTEGQSDASTSLRAKERTRTLRTTGAKKSARACHESPRDFDITSTGKRLRTFSHRQQSDSPFVHEGCG